MVFLMVRRLSWAAIEKLKKLHNNQELLAKFIQLGFIVVTATSVYLNLCKRRKIRFESLPIEDSQQTSSSSTWRNLCKEIPSIELEATRMDLSTKVSTFLSKLARFEPDIRYWIDPSVHEEEEFNEESELMQLAASDSEGKSLCHKTEWSQRLFIIEVAKISEFEELNSGDEISEQKIRQSSLKKYIGLLASNILKNFEATGATEGYGAVTCYSHWIFVKAVVSNTRNDFSITVHNRIEKLNPNINDIKIQKAFLSLVFVARLAMYASTTPKSQYNVSHVWVRTEDHNEVEMVVQAVAKTSRSLILKASSRRIEQTMCLKCSRDASDSFMNEIEVIKQLNRVNVPNVPRLLFSGELYSEQGKYHCFATDSFGECVATVLPLPLSEVHNIIHDVLQALIGMHKLQLVHADVKPANIVRVWDPVLQRYKYSLIDFGFSFVEGTVTDGNWGCSIEYASIQVLDGNAPTIRDDLKSLWYSMMHCLLGSLPWQYLSGFVELTKWSKEGWHDDLEKLNSELYKRLVALYKAIDTLPDPHQAWQQYLTLQSRDAPAQ